MNIDLVPSTNLPPRGGVATPVGVAGSGGPTLEGRVSPVFCEESGCRATGAANGEGAKVTADVRGGGAWGSPITGTDAVRSAEGAEGNLDEDAAALCGGGLMLCG